jgi:hypothetical protein
MDDRRARVEAICDAALDRDPGERSAFVAEACGGDEELRREVEALLRQAQASERFLSHPVGAVAAEVFADAGHDAASGSGGAPLIGRRLGVYEVLSLLGAGGMGEVYRARDTMLGRDVAIKILPRHFTWNPDRLARFEREARLLAALNHPQIGAIYGTIDIDHGRGIVLELVEGPTLAERLSSESMPLDEALHIARQIAEALEAAHEKGVVHRDLKPGNIKIAPNGVVKVIDFGLAKARGDDGSDPAAPALSPSMTRSGVIIGSPAYMSPEQARGLPVDKRADIWAFGCVLFEMLAGLSPFHADSASGAMAKVIEREPDWGALPPDLPPALVRLLKRCLNKKAVNRLHDIADARLELVDVLSGPEAVAPSPRARLGALPWAGIAVGVIAAAVAGFFIGRTLQPRLGIDDRVQRVAVLPPADARVASEFVELSPDGRFLAFAAASADGRSRLWVRPLDGAAARPLAGTDDARFPFWSPDSRYIGFFAQHQLKKIQPEGGPAQVICDAPYGFGGTWSRDGVIVFAPDASTFLYRVAAEGGTPTPVSTLDVSQEQLSHSVPAFLPDGRHFLYTVTHRLPRRNTVEIAALGEPVGRRVLDADSAVRYASSPGDRLGYLVFVRLGTLMAQPFDLEARQVTGDAIVLADGTIPVMSIGAGAPFSVSDDGILAFRNTSLESRLTWFDRSGRAVGTLATPEQYNGVEISPDGTHVAVERLSARDGTSNIWLVDSATGTLTQFTFTGATHPKWSADGRFLTFNHERSILRKRIDGSGEEEVLRESDANMLGPVGDWAPDGTLFAMRRIPAQTGASTGRLFLITPRPNVKATEVQQAQFNGRFSPDGKWLAYTADLNGGEEVYVQPLPMTGAQWLVSRGGGVRPHWRRDGRELFYIASSAVNGAGRLMAAPIMPGPSFRVGTPVPLFDVAFVPGDANDYSYSVSPDGQRVLVIQPTEDATRAPFTLLLNWTARLRKH